MNDLISRMALKKELAPQNDWSWGNGAYVRDMIDAMPTVDAEPVDGAPRLVPLEDLFNGAGVGYEENWLKGEDGEEDAFVLDECAWCKGGVVVSDSEIVSRAALERLYNRPYGLRVWSRKPSEEQREKTPWAG